MKGLSEAAIEHMRANIEHTPEGPRIKGGVSYQRHVYRIVSNRDVGGRKVVNFEFKNES